MEALPQGRAVKTIRILLYLRTIPVVRQVSSCTSCSSSFDSDVRKLLILLEEQDENKTADYMRNSKKR